MNKPTFLALSTLFCLQYLRDPNSIISFVATAKEIEATSEWQLLQEGDTIPAGLHVKMDLSTGEKWVKLMDTETDETSTALAATTDGDGKDDDESEEQKSSPPNNPETTATTTMSSSETPPPLPPKYDFKTMHRALSKLPNDERLRMGGLPPLPDSYGDNASATMYFEAQMTELWVRRQRELADAQELLADLPQILEERIASIRSYLRRDDGITDGSDIVAVLDDLEYQLNDLDNARDFHTLGGWPLLVSLLSPRAHAALTAGGNETTTGTTTTTPEDVQSLAAWSIGTAVKNTAEFFPWAMERVGNDVNNDDENENAAPTTPVSLVLTAFRSSSHTGLKLKSLYALGGLMRGNPLTYSHFLSLDGPSILLTEFLASVAREDWKMAGKIVSLVHDLVADVILEGRTGGGELLAVAFSGQDWCDAALELLRESGGVSASVREKGLMTLKIIGKECTRGRAAVEQFKRSFTEATNRCGQDTGTEEKGKGGDICDGTQGEIIHEDVEEELLALVDEVMLVMPN